MSKSEKLAMLKIMQEEQDETVLSTYLLLAEKKLLLYMYGPDSEITAIPDKFATAQVEATVYLLNKRGIEGQISHSENGITRVYDSGDLPSSLLAGLPCYAMSARVHG